MSSLLRKKFRSRRYHTPFCPHKKCNKSHHDLVKMLCCRHVIPGDLPMEVKKLIKFHTRSGWNHDSNIPERFKELRLPLIFLACAFGNACFVEGLLRNNFNPCVKNKHGETCLHAAAKHMYGKLADVGVRLKIVEHLTKKSVRENAFEHILQALTDAYPKILAVQDNDGRTPLHCSASNILQRFHFGEFHKRAVFYRFCLQTMITRLLKLEADGILTRSDILEIVKSPENKNGDSVLHLLARDRSYGFKTLKLILDLLFPGKLPDIKNKENKTVFNIAWETNSESAMKLFFSGPTERPQQEQQQSHCTEAKCSPAGTGPEESPNCNADAGKIVVNIDIVKTESCPSSDSEGDKNATSTGNLFPKVTVTSFQPGIPVPSETNLPEQVMPKVTGTFSLACEVCEEITKAFASRKYSVSSTSSEENSVASRSSSSRQSIDEPTMSMLSPESLGISDNQGSGNMFSNMQGTGTENSALEAPEMTENVGQAAKNVGEVVNSLGKITVEVLLSECITKLHEVDTGILETKQLQKEGATALSTKKLKLKILGIQLRLLKKEITFEERNIKELKKKEDILCKERRGLKKKMTYCKRLKRGSFE